MPFLWGQPLPHSTAPDRSLLIVPILSGGNKCHVYCACVIEQGASQNERKSHEEKTTFFSFDPRSSLRYFHLFRASTKRRPRWQHSLPGQQGTYYRYLGSLRGHYEPLSPDQRRL